MNYEKSLVFLWDVLKKTPSCSLLNNLKVYSLSIMKNVNLNLGFRVDKEKLREYFAVNKEHGFFATINGFSGSRFIKRVESIGDMPVYTFEISRKDNSVSLKEEISYSHFCDLTGRNKAEEKNISVAVFWSGRSLFSGIHEKYLYPTIKRFLDIIRGIKDEIIAKEYSAISLEDYLRPNKRGRG